MVLALKPQRVFKRFVAPGQDRLHPLIPPETTWWVLLRIQEPDKPIRGLVRCRMRAFFVIQILDVCTMQ
jgi:hypothetical protein